MMWAYGVGISCMDNVLQYLTWGVEFHATHYREQQSPNFYRAAMGIFPKKTVEPVLATRCYDIDYCTDAGLAQIVHDAFQDSWSAGRL